VGAEGALAKLRFAVKRHVRLHEWVENGEKLLDLRKESAFRGQGTLTTIAKKSLLSAWRDGTDEVVEKAMHDFVARYIDDILKAEPTLSYNRKSWMAGN
jgi:hypothetical protein